MDYKPAEVRDRATFISVLAILIDCEGSTQEKYLQRHAGYHKDFPEVILMELESRKSHMNPTSWGDRTMQSAHRWIANNWHGFKSGAVIDVEYILGEVDKPKISQRLTSVYGVEE